MIRVLQVLGSLQRGGAETMIMNVYRKINRNEIQFDFLVKERVNNGYEEEVTNLGGRIFCVPSLKKIGIIKYIKEQKKIMVENGPYDIIHSHVNTLSGIILYVAKKSNINIRISHSHTTKQDNKILKFLISKYATHRVSCGENAGAALFGSKEFIIIPNGINTSDFLPSEKEREKNRKKLGLVDSCINICHIGRFVEVKNHKFILELSKKLKQNGVNHKIYLLGDGPLLDNIKKGVEDNKLHDNVVILGSVSNTNEYLKSCDIFILPSLFEGMPVTVIESQCAGIPSIVSDKVTQKIDLGLHLVNFLKLDIDKWYEFITTKKYNCIFDVNYIKRIFKKEKYDVDVSSKMLIDYYKKILK